MSDPSHHLAQGDTWNRALDAVAHGADAEAEATALVELLDADERVSMLDGGQPFWTGLSDLGSGGYHRRPFPACRVDRLGIPGFEFSDGPRGVVIGPATAFPVAIARGATFDPDLERAVGDVIGREVRAVGASLFGDVCINLLRHLAWGRAQETYGEDPHHLGVMGAAAIAGVQRHVMATAKHFALNSMENARFTVDVSVDESTLHEVYLPHFRAAVTAGVACVMSAYNSVNGEWCGESHALLDHVLRRELGFTGFVISDWIFGLRDGVKSLEAGLDVEMPYRMVRHQRIVDALDAGTLDAALVDRACRRVITTLLRFAVLEPSVDLTQLATAEHRALARKVASRSFVMLANNPCNGTASLPIDPSASLAVIGPLGSRCNIGDGGSSDVLAPLVVTLADGLRARFERCSVDDGHDLELVSTLAASHDAVIVVVGNSRDDEGEYIGASNSDELTALLPGPDDPASVERFQRYIATHDIPAPHGTPVRGLGADRGGDRRSLRLSEGDRERVEAALCSNPRTIVVVMGATAALVGDLAARVGALLCVFYPGMEGGHSLADVITGASEPAGRLPFAIPQRAEDLVDFDRDATSVVYGPLHGQWHLDANGTPPAFPFGFGLGWGSVTVESATRSGDSVVVDVSNPHARGTDSVIFCHLRADDAHRPWRLGGFARVVVGARGTARVTIPFDTSVLHRFDDATGQMVMPETAYSIEIGRWARDAEGIILSGPT